MTAAPAALVVARAPSAGGLGRGLEPLLGPERCARLGSLLIRRGGAWAAAAAPGAAFAVVEPPEALDEVVPLLPDGVVAFARDGANRADGLRSAVRRIGRGPLLIADPTCPRLGSAHAAAALEDLASGCDLVFGSTLEGGWYLAGVREPRPELLAAVPEVGPGTGGIGRLLERARALDAEVGMLRHERGLQSPDDVAALLADPLSPGDLRAALTD